MKLRQGKVNPPWTCLPCINGHHRQCKQDRRMTLSQKQMCTCAAVDHDETRLRDYLR